MRICFLSRRYFPAISGMSVYARNMTKALADRGHELVMISQYREDAKGIGIYGGGPPPAEPWMQVHGLRSLGEERANEQVPADYERDLREMVATAEALHQEKPFDVVHAQYCYPNGLAALEISDRLGIPNVVSIQGGDGHWVGLCCQTHGDAMQAVLRKSMALIIGCKSFSAEVQENHHIEADRFTIIPGATNTEQFTPAERLQDKGAPLRFLYHGRVDQRKGIHDFIRASCQLRRKGHELQLVISGIGPDLESSREMVQEFGLEDITEFTGASSYDEAPRVYDRGDVFVSPTYAEGFSNTILEAMASRLPIISTNSVGVVDCLKHEYNGLLVEPGDIGGLVRSMERMLVDRAARKRITDQAYEDVLKLYSWAVVAQQIEEVYQQVQEQPLCSSWRAYYDFSTTVEDADLSCRFRKDPHLL